VGGDPSVPRAGVRGHSSRNAAGDKNISVAGGAETVQQLVAAGLVDEIQLHVAPLFLGRGKRLFDQLGKAIELERIRVVDSPGVTHLKYSIVK
jgi:dihydrofolate reductase